MADHFTEPPRPLILRIPRGLDHDGGDATERRLPGGLRSAVPPAAAELAEGGEQGLPDQLVMALPHTEFAMVQCERAEVFGEDLRVVDAPYRAGQSGDEAFPLRIHGQREH